MSFALAKGKLQAMTKELLQDARTFLTLILLSGFLILFDSANFLNFPKSLVQSVTSPIQYGLYKSANTFGKQFSFIFMVRRTAQEKKALEEQLATVLSENANLRKKLAETQAFAGQQQALNPQTFKWVEARPIGISRYLFLDKGSDDGLKNNQTVVYKDTIIGKIISADPKKSAVLLTSDPDSKIAAFSSSNEGKAKGVLVGEYGSEMKLDKILHQEPIKVGDLVYSEGSEIEIPRGLVLGQVSELLSQDNEIFKQARVKPIFNVTDLDLVFVIVN